MRSGKPKDHVTLDQTMHFANKSTHPKSKAASAMMFPELRQKKIAKILVKPARCKQDRDWGVSLLSDAKSDAKQLPWHEKEEKPACQGRKYMEMLQYDEKQTVQHDCACRFSSEGDRPSNSCKRQKSESKRFAILHQKISMGTKIPEHSTIFMTPDSKRFKSVLISDHRVSPILALLHCLGQGICKRLHWARIKCASNACACPKQGFSQDMFLQIARYVCTYTCMIEGSLEV